MMKLIPMVDFVVEQDKYLQNQRTASPAYYELDKWKRVGIWERSMIKMFKYANFLNQPLTLGMFVPCVGGVVFKMPKVLDWKTEDYTGVKFQNALSNYQQAKERVLFDIRAAHMEDSEMYYVHVAIASGSTIEDLINRNNVGLTLTESAIKQLQL